MRFYIASGLKNSSLVSELISFLEARGHICTYDWTEHNDVRSEGEARMNEVSFSEASAVKDAELFIALLPGGNGTHTELGIALATRVNKRIMLWSDTGDEFVAGDNTCVFYFHPAVERIVSSFDELTKSLEDLY